MATAIDGAALILGTATDPERSNPFFIISSFITGVAFGVRRVIDTLYSAWNHEIEPFELPVADGLKESMKLVITLDSTENGVEALTFLDRFYSAIDLKTHVIDIDSLIETETSTNLKLGYRLLFDTMCHRPSNWIEKVKKNKITEKTEPESQNPEKVEDYQFRISDKHFPDFLKWFRRAKHTQVINKNHQVSVTLEINMPF
jgi:hypothetical protein